MTASDKKLALQHHPVRGTSASVNVVDESKKHLLISMISLSISVVSTISVLRILEVALGKLMVLVRENYSHTTQGMVNIKDQLCFKRKMAFPIHDQRKSV